VNGDVQSITSGINWIIKHDIGVIRSGMVVNTADNQKDYLKNINTAMHHGENVLMIF
jgi:hypothetical protein